MLKTALNIIKNDSYNIRHQECKAGCSFRENVMKIMKQTQQLTINFTISKGTRKKYSTSFTAAIS